VLRLGVNVIPASHGFEPEEVLRAADWWKRLSLFAAPTMVRRLVGVASGADVSGFRTIIYGGGPMYVADIIEAFRAFGPRLAQIYGQGETPMTITTLSRNEIAASDHPLWMERLGSVGRPFGFMEVAVHDQDDQPLAPGQEGEIVCRGPTVMTGYWRDTAASEEALRGGRLHTGDVGVFDEHGYLTLKDRTKDLIISGGSNIYPREVEEVLQTHPTPNGARWWSHAWSARLARSSRRTHLTHIVSSASLVSSAQSATCSSSRSRRTITARF
jgi:long-chain acyl-CoA synthetase